ncbi:hypothetical protein PAL_GLEAN10015739 [Pteropus alecto]|uniref:Protein FAM208B n=1 Tax=Pteropus alecto TaxID=9402 RepID=L5KZV7_PTEAL|nr:hypothetical protein PAL_GLEAN10015739 [Pteropus alecto]
MCFSPLDPILCGSNYKRLSDMTCEAGVRPPATAANYPEAGRVRYLSDITHLRNHQARPARLLPGRALSSPQHAPPRAVSGQSWYVSVDSVLAAVLSALWVTQQKGRVKFVPENYTTNYTSPSSGYDCHVAANTNKVSHRTSHFRAFELSQYYLYELSGSTAVERPRQIHPYVIVAFQYREPKKMAAPAHKSIPHELDFKYVMKVSSLKKRLPEVAFRKQNYLEQKVSYQDMCFNMYEVELSNKQGEKIDKLTEVIKNKQLLLPETASQGYVLLVCIQRVRTPPPNHLFRFISSAHPSARNCRGNELHQLAQAFRCPPSRTWRESPVRSWERSTGRRRNGPHWTLNSFGDEQIGLHGLHVFHSSRAAELKDLKVEDDISLKVIPILPALNCALLEAKKSFTEEGLCPNTLVKHNFQELYKVDRSLSLTVSQDEVKETALFGKLSNGFDLVPPAEKCPLQSLTQLKSYFSDPSGYILEVSTALDLLAERPQSPSILDGICDAGFSLVMTPDPEFLDSEAEVRKETEIEKNSDKMFKARKRTVAPLNPASNLRVQPKRKASMPPVVQSKRVNLCRPFPKRTPAGTHKGATSPATLKLVKGQFPQKRKRGAEVLTAQFVQTTKLDRKNQEAPVSKDVPVATNTKRARKQEKSPVKTVPRAKPPVKKSPQKQRVNVVKGNQNPRIRKQPQPVQETASQLQSEMSSDGQEDAKSINIAQRDSITVAQKGPAEDSMVNCDSQALNLLADLALSAATSATPASEPSSLPPSSELPQNDVLPKEHCLSSASDHEYHRGVKSQKGGLLPQPSSEKSDPPSGSTIGQEGACADPGRQSPVDAQAALPEETPEASDASRSSFVAVEHSYALLLAEHSKKLLQQRGVPGPAFAKNGTKGSEAGTPVGKVMPFRHQQNTSPLQKPPADLLLKHKGRLLPSSLRDFSCSHTVSSCDGSFKVTFKCEANYVFSLDSKYTNNPLEKTVLRALHGPWNTDIPDNVEEVKLLLHMWVALFYSNQNKVIRSSRKVVEHSNPAKFVSINSTIDSFEFSEIEDSPGVDRCSVDPLLETKGAPRGHSAEASFPDTDSLLPFIKPHPAEGLELWVQNEQKEIFAREGHPGTPESQNFVCSYNNEIIEGKAEQESSDKLVLSATGSIQTNGPSIPSEGKTFEPLDSTGVTSYNDTVTQTTFTKTCDGISSQSMICQKSVYSTLESKADIFHATVQAKTSDLQGLTQHGSPINKECQPSLERKDDMGGYVMLNLEPVTVTFEKNACSPVQTEVVNRTGKPTSFNVESVKQVSPATSLKHPGPTFERAETHSLTDISSLAASGQNGAQCHHASAGSGETLAKETCSLRREIPVPGSPPSSEDLVVEEALPLVKSSHHSLPREEVKLSQEFFPQPERLFSVSSEEIMEPSQVEEASSAASATLEKNYSFNCIPSRSSTSDGSLEVKSDESGLNSENGNFKSCNSVFTKPTNLSISGEEVSLELEDDSDIDLTLTMSPPTSPRGEMPAGEIEQHQEALLSKLQLQDVDEDIIESERVAFTENGEVNSADYAPVLPTGSESEDREGDRFRALTLVLPKGACALEVAEEVNITSDFPFGSLIEEVSPASSPDPQVPVEAALPSQVVSPRSLKRPDSQCEKSDTFSQVESVDLAVTDKEHPFVGPAHPVGQDNLAWVQQVKLSAEMPLVFNDHPGRRERPLTLLGRVTEEIVPSEHDEAFSFSEQVPCCGTELTQPASVASFGTDLKTSLEKLVTSGNPLQPVSIENRHSDLKRLAWDTSEPPFSSRKIVENKSLADTFVSTAAPSGIVHVPLKQTSPKSIKKSPFSSAVAADEGSGLQAQPLSCAVVMGGVTQAYVHSETPTLASSSGGAAVTHCTRPSNTGTGFQTQELSVRMASLLNSEPEAELHEKAMDVGGVGSQSNTPPEGKQETMHVPQDVLTCGTEDVVNGGLFPVCFHAGPYQNTAVNSENAKKEPPATFGARSCTPLVCGVSEEQVEDKTVGEGLRAEDPAAPGGDVGIIANPHIPYEPLSGGSDQDIPGECGSLQLDMEGSCTSRCTHTKKKAASKDGYDSFLSLNNSDNESWGYSNRGPGLETSVPPRNWSVGLKKEGQCVPRYVQIRDCHGIPRTYANFKVSKELRETRRTLHYPKWHPSFTAHGGLLSSWTDPWRMADDLTQNTLDLEYLRFEHKLKQIVKNGDSQRPASSSSGFLKGSPLHIAAGAFPLTRVPEAPVLYPASRSRSPLVITVVHSDARQQSQHLRGHMPSSSDTSSFWKERGGHGRNHLTGSERSQAVSCHLNKLKYNSTLKESRSDIALILSEYAEFNKVMMNRSPVVFQDKESNVASREAASQELYSSSPRRSASYEDMITDLCASLHIKLKSVVKDACKSPFLFYLVETEDKSFFVRTKTLLRKGGHTEMEPQHFCQAFHREHDTLMVIIRNEDIASHLHQIPSLLKLKHFPSVTFAGVDSPEDVLSHTYQELFRTGGFVVSDDGVLETLTLVQLKEIVKVLEKLNGNGRWKWLLHYRENKKLKDVRMDSTAHKKNLILKLYQSANIIELLHYHPCDSPSSTKAEHLKCLLNLQTQHIQARFAVLLTGDSAAACLDVSDVNYKSNVPFSLKTSRYT